MRRLTVLYSFIASAMVVGQTTIHCYCISKYYANFAPIDFYVLSILLTLWYTDLLQYLYYCMLPHVRRYYNLASMYGYSAIEAYEFSFSTLNTQEFCPMKRFQMKPFLFFL